MRVHYDLMENMTNGDLIVCDTCGTFMDEAMTVNYETKTVEHSYENCFMTGSDILTFEEALASLEKISWVPDEPKNTLIADLKEKL